MEKGAININKYLGQDMLHSVLEENLEILFRKTLYFKFNYKQM